jgi:hypothetical protein
MPPQPFNRYLLTASADAFVEEGNDSCRIGDVKESSGFDLDINVAAACGFCFLGDEVAEPLLPISIGKVLERSRGCGILGRPVPNPSCP